MTTDLATTLAATTGTTCVVGAGGKKTLLYRLANELSRAVVTATVRIPIFDGNVADVVVTDDPVDAIGETAAWPIGVVPEREETRYVGYAPEVIDRIGNADVADVVLVKADGARNRLFKAPGDCEPIIPRGTDTVIPIASVKVVGMPLDDDHVHRPERVTALTGLAAGEAVTAATVAEVLSHQDGGLRGVPSGATAIPVINMVDDASLETIGREVAVDVLDRSDDIPRVVLTKLIADDPVIDVIRPSE